MNLIGKNSFELDSDTGSADGRIRLSEAGPGQAVRVERLRGDQQFQSRLRNMGLREGSEILVIKQAPLADPMEYQIGSIHLSLRRAEASQIVVQPISGQV